MNMQQKKEKSIEIRREEEQKFLSSVLIFIMINLAIAWCLLVSGSGELWSALKGAALSSAVHYHKSNPDKNSLQHLADHGGL